MFTTTSTAGITTMLLFYAKSLSSQPHGVVVKAGPAFSWLKRLDRIESASVDNKCYAGGLRDGDANLLKASAVLHRHRTPSSSSSPNDRIIGGQRAAVGQFPYAGALRRGSTSTASCGATLISPRHLLTAAHCVPSDMSQPAEGAASVNQTLWLGGVCYYAYPEDGCPAADMFEVETELAAKVYYSNSARDVRPLEEMSEHEPVDLALIQLHTPIDGRLFDSGRVDYACLPPPQPLSPLPESLCYAGWGKHSEGRSDQYTVHLRFVRLLTRPRDEWSANTRSIDGCELSRVSPRFCQFPPGGAQASAYLGDSGSGALAVRGDNGAPANADVLYGVHTSSFKFSYSVNASDWSEPYVRRMLGRSVSVQYHLDELCYYLQLGCGVGGVIGMGTTLRLSSFYLKRERSEMPRIVPFTLLSDDGHFTNQATPEGAVAALVHIRNGAKRGATICLAMAISPRHLVTTRKCIMGRYLRAWQKKGMAVGGNSSYPSVGIVFPAMDAIKEVGFIAWQRATAGATHNQPAAAGNDLVIIQLASDE